jgi:hypothetical protein
MASTTHDGILTRFKYCHGQHHARWHRRAHCHGQHHARWHRRAHRDDRSDHKRCTKVHSCHMRASRDTVTRQTREIFALQVKRATAANHTLIQQDVSALKFDSEKVQNAPKSALGGDPSSGASHTLSTWTRTARPLTSCRPPPRRPGQTK